eukprot:1087082-Rhodomonas_salina.1
MLHERRPRRALRERIEGEGGESEDFAQRREEREGAEEGREGGRGFWSSGSTLSVTPLNQHKNSHSWHALELRVRRQVLDRYFCDRESKGCNGQGLAWLLRWARGEDTVYTMTGDKWIRHFALRERLEERDRGGKKEGWMD